MEPVKQTIKIKPHAYYVQKYLKKLNQNTAVISSMTDLCGGWYLETFKQVINKLCKNKSSPLPLFFPSVESMQLISKNKQSLKNVFKTFDTRGYGKIDGCQLYAACLSLSKGSYETFLKTIVDIFGFEAPGKINRNEFFYFLDSFYRAIPKILILKGNDNPKGEINTRLDFKCINKFLDILFDEQTSELQRNQIYQALMKTTELNQLLKYIQKKCTAAAQASRNNAILKIKIQTQVRKCIVDMVSQVQAKLE